VQLAVRVVPSLIDLHAGGEGSKASPRLVSERLVLQSTTSAGWKQSVFTSSTCITAEGQRALYNIPFCASHRSSKAGTLEIVSSFQLLGCPCVYVRYLACILRLVGTGPQHRLSHDARLPPLTSSGDLGTIALFIEFMKRALSYLGHC